MWKVSGTIGKIESLMKRINKQFRLISISGEREFDGSSYSGSEALGELRPQTFIVAKQRMHEIETQKAFIIKISRHDSCKAGGPI